MWGHKTVNDTVATDYSLNGKQVVHFKKGRGYPALLYDAQGRPAVVEWNGVKHGYVHDLQGDIVAIIDGSGSLFVKYPYDMG